tara:strand:- start:6 stop:209 length:204 start_codon:yes stop_codon:yes gene_type:complete
MLSLTMWTFEIGIDHSLKRPHYQDYRCEKKNCICSIPEMCKRRWKKYQKDLMKYMHLKFKDTYKNGS